VQRRAKRDANIFRKKVLAVTKMQAIYRGRQARKATLGKGVGGGSCADFSGRLEPLLTMAIAITVALQWDLAIIYQIGEGVDTLNAPGMLFANACGTTLVAGLLTLALMFVHKGYNRRALQLVKQALQVLVGWMWKVLVQVTDENIGAVHLAQYSAANAMWIRFGIVAGVVIVFAPLLTLLLTAVLHTLREHPPDTFAKHYCTLLLGAGTLVVGFAWHLCLVNFSLAMVQESLATEQSQANSVDYAFAAAVCRTLVVTILVTLLTGYSSFRHASKIAKPPKKADTFGQAFRDNSLYMGANSLLWLLAFEYFAVIERMAAVNSAEVDQWGPYIIFTVFAFVYFVSALVVAWRGSSRPKCCTAIYALGVLEMLATSTVPILLGFTLFASYAALVLRLATAEVAGIVFWAVGVVILTSMVVLIFLSAACSRRSADKYLSDKYRQDAQGASSPKGTPTSRRRVNAPMGTGLAAVARPPPPTSPGGYRNEQAPAAAYDRTYRQRL